MGVYIYTMRAKTANIQLNEFGPPITANLLSYAFKPYGWDEHPTNKRILSRAENFWEDREAPEYFVVGDSFENGAELRTGWRKGSGWCYDTPDFPGEHLGYLKKVGRKWTVVPTWEECYPPQTVGERFLWDMKHNSL